MKTINLFKSCLLISAICFSGIIYAQNHTNSTNNENNPPATANNGNNGNNGNNHNNGSNHNNSNNPPATANKNGNDGNNPPTTASNGGHSNQNNGNNPPSTTNKKADEVESLIVNAFPNPTQGELEISFNVEEESEVSLRLVDMTAKVIFEDVRTGYSGNYNEKFDLNAQPVGSYVLLLNVNGQVTARQILHNR